ncbi:MAG: hypothetical protein O3C67_04610 [Cyanobacteria bacterium]|nr:hypothetical protein [Cyanobacteriota bacterium]
MTAPEITRLLERYEQSGYRASYTEIQKLVYLLKMAGEPGFQGVTYRRSHYGPYAYNLNHALEGTKEEDYGQDRDRPFERVSQLIEGFETPYGLEMLATLHWVTQEDPEAAEDCQVAIQQVQAWSDRKKNLFKPRHLKVAWEHLKAEGWLAFESERKS